MLITANTHASVILVILHDHMLKNKQSHRPSLYSMTSLVVLFAYPIKLTLSTRNTVRKILSKSYCDFNDLCSAIKKYWTTFRVINTLDIPLLITICFCFVLPTSKLVRFMACQLREEARLESLLPADVRVDKNVACLSSLLTTVTYVGSIYMKKKPFV